MAITVIRILNKSINLTYIFLDLYSLMHSIPRHWDFSIHLQKIKPTEVKKNILEKIIVAPKVCKFVYQNLVEEVTKLSGNWF